MRYCCFLLFIVSLSAQAKTTSLKDLQTVISQAITKFEQTSRKQWAYQVSRFENEEGDITQSIEMHAPHIDSQRPWQLLSLNGETPTAKQMQAFTERKSKQAANEGKSHTLSLRELIQIDSLKIRVENKESLQASFDVYIERMGKKASKKLTGHLTYNKLKAFIETIEVVNTDTFSPVFSAKITDFQLTMQFQNIDESILPLQHDLNMKGTFAFFTEIDEVSSDVFTNYQWVNPTARSTSTECQTCQ